MITLVNKCDPDMVRGLDLYCFFRSTSLDGRDNRNCPDDEGRSREAGQFRWHLSGVSYKVSMIDNTRCTVHRTAIVMQAIAIPMRPIRQAALLDLSIKRKTDHAARMMAN